MIEPHPHPEGEECWDALCKWVAEKVQQPDGEPCTAAQAVVLAIGAVIGARFALIAPGFALGLAEYSNDQDGHIWESVQRGFAEDYVPWITPQVEALYHNYGFTRVSHAAVAQDTGEEKTGAPLTDDDAKNIMEGLDGFFGKGAA